MYSSSFNKFYPIIVQCEDICDRYSIQKKKHYYQLTPIICHSRVYDKKFFMLTTAKLAQSVERGTAEREAAGSIPRAGPHAGC